MPEHVRFARRFVIRRPGQPDIHGVQFPSGRVLADDPDRSGLIAATSTEHVTDDPDATTHWATEDR